MLARAAVAERERCSGEGVDDEKKKAFFENAREIARCFFVCLFCLFAKYYLFTERRPVAKSQRSQIKFFFLF